MSTNWPQGELGREEGMGQSISAAFGDIIGEMGAEDVQRSVREDFSLSISLASSTSDKLDLGLTKVGLRDRDLMVGLEVEACPSSGSVNPSSKETFLGGAVKATGETT